MDNQVLAAYRALGVLTKTPHIVVYLATYDPKAFTQAKEAFYALAELLDAEPCGLCGEALAAHRPASGNAPAFCEAPAARPGDRFVRQAKGGQQ